MVNDTLLLASDGSAGALEAADWVQQHWCSPEHKVVVITVAAEPQDTSMPMTSGIAGDSPGAMPAVSGGVETTGQGIAPGMISSGIGGMWMIVPPPSRTPGESYASHWTAAHDQLNATIGRLHGFAEVEGRVQGGRGHVVDGILAAIDEIEPTLVVVGRRGLSRLERWVLGSVSQSVVAKSAVPVLVIP